MVWAQLAQRFCSHGKAQLLPLPYINIIVPLCNIRPSVVGGGIGNLGSGGTEGQLALVVFFCIVSRIPSADVYRSGVGGVGVGVRVGGFILGGGGALVCV